MKRFAIILTLLSLSGCFKNSYSVASFPEMPSELSDCKFFNMSNKDGAYITVARCPNSTTSTTFQSGKTKKTVVIIDGVEYEAKENSVDISKPQDSIPN